MHFSDHLQKGLLDVVLARHGVHDAVVDRALADQAVTKDGALLALPVKSCVRLLVLFQIPRRRLPNEYMSAILHVESVLNRGRLAQKEAYLARVPCLQGLGFA